MASQDTVAEKEMKSFLKKKWFWVNIAIPLTSAILGFIGGDKVGRNAVVVESKENVIENTTNIVTISQQIIQDALTSPRIIYQKL